jgi:hypothetical protein
MAGKLMGVRVLNYCAVTMIVRGEQGGDKSEETAIRVCIKPCANSAACTFPYMVAVPL